MLQFSSNELYLAGIDDTKEGGRFISFSECALGCCGVDDTRGGSLPLSLPCRNLFLDACGVDGTYFRDFSFGMACVCVVD
jgi:hypothetical protein